MQPGNLCSLPRSHVEMEEENQLHRVGRLMATRVLWHPSPDTRTHQIKFINKKITVNPERLVHLRCVPSLPQCYPTQRPIMNNQKSPAALFAQPFQTLPVCNSCQIISFPRSRCAAEPSPPALEGQADSFGSLPMATHSPSLSLCLHSLSPFGLRLGTTSPRDWPTGVQVSQAAFC